MLGENQNKKNKNFYKKNFKKQRLIKAHWVFLKRHNTGTEKSCLSKEEAGGGQSGLIWPRKLTHM